jgi:hypothetical protein
MRPRKMKSHLHALEEYYETLHEVKFSSMFNMEQWNEVITYIFQMDFSPPKIQP